MTSCRIVIADDHKEFRDIVKKILGDKTGMEVVGEAAEGPGLAELLKTSNANMVILKISLPGLNVIRAIKVVKQTCPGLKVLLLTPDKDCDYLFHAICAGADGCLLKENVDTELCRAVEVIEYGDVYFSPSFLPSGPDAQANG